MHIFVQLTTTLAIGCNQPPAECVPQGPFPRHKVEYEADHSVPFSAQVKNNSQYISTPPFVPPRHATGQLTLILVH